MTEAVLDEAFSKFGKVSKVVLEDDAKESRSDNLLFFIGASKPSNV